MKGEKIGKRLRATIAISVVLGFVIMGTNSVFADIQKLNIGGANMSANMMEVENTTGKAGDTGHVINISGRWESEIAAYSIAMYYDSAIIEIVNVSLEGTVAEFEVYPDYYEYWHLVWSCNESSNLSYLVAGAYTLNPVFWISAGSGVLFKLVVNIKGNATVGDTVLDLEQDVGEAHSRCEYSTSNGTALLPELVDGTLTIKTGYICGDANGDGEVNVADVVYLINYLFIPGSPEPIPDLCIGDVNGDGNVNVADVVYLINYLFLPGSPEPVDNCCG